MPNSFAEQWIHKKKYHLFIFASKNIEPGTEITYDYKMDMDDWEAKQRCKCKSPNCSGIMGVTAD